MNWITRINSGFRRIAAATSIHRVRDETTVRHANHGGPPDVLNGKIREFASDVDGTANRLESGL